MMVFDLSGIFAVALLAFWIWALIDCILTDARICRFLPKVAWILIILVLSDLGALLWLVIGRPDRSTRRLSRAASAAARPRPVAPDDLPQPASNTVITDRRSAELDRMLAQWEAEQEEKHRKSRGNDADET
jgi:hypothetical protein